MTPPVPKSKSPTFLPTALPTKYLRHTDLLAVTQLATQATTSVTRMAEGVHQAVWRTLGAPSGPAPEQTRGLTGLIYAGVRGVTQLVGKSLELGLTQLQPWLASADNAQPNSPQREAVLAALNGVMGDRLVASGNALATAMTLRRHGETLNWGALPQDFNATGKVLLLVHGLCMNDLQWNSEAGGAALADVVASSLGYTPIYLRYNTGQHISQNGRELASVLDDLVKHWPVPVEDIAIVAHSMGGLVARSAVHQVQMSSGQVPRWLALLKHIVFLGTPHHGAPLERAGSWVDVLLNSSPYSKPFTKLAQLRSGGITDLRYGHLVDADWAGRDRFRRQPDKRTPVPLPLGVACYTVAATTGTQRSLLADRLLGDGLVPLRSALGQHDDAKHSLAFDASSQWIAYRTNHMQLLHSPAVAQQVLGWLKPTSNSASE